MHKLARIIAAVFAFAICAPSLAATYYKIGRDINSNDASISSFTGNGDTTNGWSTVENAATVDDNVVFEGSDFIVGSGTRLRTNLVDADISFGGQSLKFVDGGELQLKKGAVGGNRNITFSALSIEGMGTITMGQDQSQFTLKGTFSLAADSTFRTSFGTSSGSGDYRPLVIDSTLTGDATTAIDITGSGNAANTSGLTLNAVGGFYGTITSTADSPTFTLVINGAFGGTITSLPASTTAVKIDYDGLPAATGLRVASTTIPAALKTKLTLYSATTDFTQDRLPLVTFPAGTDVDPTEFTVKHATSANGTATAFPHLMAVTNADDTVTLAVDAIVPAYAKMVKGEGDVYAWRFYNDDWDDITDACGLSVPDPTIKVYVTSTEEVASILANPGTPAGYRIGNLSADADLTSLSPLVIETGSEIDLNGHALTVSGTVVDALKSSTRDLVVNGNFEAKSLSNGAYDTSAISGWSKSGTVALIKNNNSYAYKQSSSGSGDKQNTTVMCYIAKNGYITQTINVPEQVLCTLSLNKTNKNYYNGGKKYNSSDGSVQIDGSSKTTLASNAGNQGSFSTKFELAAGSHTLKIACTSGTGFSVDNVKLTCTPSTGRITSSVEGGELHVNVPSGSTVTNSAVSITGHVKFVKEGAGTFVSKRTELYYDGGNEIVEGKLTTAEGSGSNRDWSAAYRTLGATGKTMTVRKNGTLDIAGNYEYGNYLIVLDGGTLRSGKVIDTGPINQTTNTSWAGIGQLSLTTNSTFYLRSDTLFSGWDSVPIKLNGHELQFQLNVDSKNVWMAKDMTNGTIRLTPANAGKRRFAIFKRNVDARTVDVIDEAGCICPLTTFSVRSYTVTAPSGNEWWKGTANMYVYGTFTPATDYFYGCTMMDGSTIDLSGRSGSWSTTSAHDCGRRTVDFANGATIYVKLGDRHRFSSRTPVIGWTTRPSNLDGLTFKRAEGNVKMVKRADGVYIQPSLVVIVK